MGSIGWPELLIMFFVLFFVLGALIFWVWMLIDCAINEPDGVNKIVWILVILFAHFIGAAIYFLFRRSRRAANVGA